MGGGKSKKKPAKLIVVPEGLQIEDDKQFYKDIRAALMPVVGTGCLTLMKKQTGQRCLVYIRQPTSPVIQGREGPIPALPLFLDDRQSAWLVVELESEFGVPLTLKHVSLKLWQGMTIETSHLCFRAEWDVRDSESNHAQRPCRTADQFDPRGGRLDQFVRSLYQAPVCVRDGRLISGS